MCCDSLVSLKCFSLKVQLPGEKSWVGSTNWKTISFLFFKILLKKGKKLPKKNHIDKQNCPKVFIFVYIYILYVYIYI